MMKLRSINRAGSEFFNGSIYTKFTIELEDEMGIIHHSMVGMSEMYSGAFEKLLHQLVDFATFKRKNVPSRAFGKCIGAVGAYLANSNLEEFEAYTGTVPPWTLLDLARYLMTKGWVMGCGAKIAGNDTSGDHSSIHMIIEFDKPAIITANNGDHVMFWNGRKLYDPDGKFTELKLEELYEWFPVEKIQ